MHYKKLLTLFFFITYSSCTSVSVKNEIRIIEKETFSNKGFTLVYSNILYDEKIVSNKLQERELIIFQRNLKKNTQVKISNILNNKSLIVKVGKKTKYPLFNNSVISARIAKELDINLDEPYVEIIAIPENSLFIAKKAKTFDEEKNVANKVPVNDISIDNLNDTQKVSIKSTPKTKFSYTIKIADFFFEDTAVSMIKRIKSETNQSGKIKKISDKKYRVYLGPYTNINSLQKSYNSINILEFDNIEIIKND